MLKRRCRNRKIGTVVAKSGAQLAPTSGYLQIEGQNPFAVESQHAVEPSCERRGEIGVCCSLPRNPALDLTDRNDTDEKIGEIERGISQQRATDPDFAARLAAWLDRVLALYGERVLPFDLQIARRWGQLSAALGNDSADLMISATALEHGLTVVTRNVSDFEPTGVATLNPFGSRPSRKC